MRNDNEPHAHSGMLVDKLTERLIRLTNCISRIQTAFIEQQKDYSLLSASLEDLLAISASDFGFIGEVWTCPVTSQPVLRFLALSNIAWNEQTQKLYQNRLEQQLEFRNMDTLFGYSLRTGETVISNTPNSHPASRGLPPGHPPLNTYLGIPIYYNTELVAMVALANRPEPYTQADVDFLLPLLNTLGQLIYVGKMRAQEINTKKQLMNVLEAANAATWSLNTKTETLTVNERWASMLGYQLDEIEPVTLSWMRDLMHPEDLLASRNAMYAHFSGQSEYYDSVFRIRHKSGQWVWVHGRGQVLSGDETSGRMMYGINMDVTEQRNLQHRLERVAALVPGVVLTIVHTQHMTIQLPYVSEGISKLVPLQPSQIVSEPDALLRLIKPADLIALNELISRQTPSQQSWRYRFELLTADTTEQRWLEIHAQADIEQSNYRVWHCYLYDVTELVQTELKMQLAKEEAEKAANVKSAFLANMSHEIRTPMNGVIGMLDVLAEANTDYRLNDNITTMRESAYSLLTIIDDILDFSKLEVGKLSISVQACKLRELIEQVFDLLDMMALRQHVEMHLYIDPALDGQFMLDPHRIRQIIVNLVSNAIKFSACTGRDAKVLCEFHSIDILDGQYQLVFSVQDNGIGIEPHTLTRLFKPFVQADESTSRQYGGTGLGLSITKQLVKLMGGEVTAKSTYQQGSCFTVALPIFETARGQALTPLAGITVSVLWQDDVPSLRHYENYLINAGAQVRRCYSIEHNPDEHVWLIDSVILEQMDFASRDSVLPRPMVLLSRGKRRKLRLLSSGVIGLDANCLKQSTLISAVKQAHNQDWPKSPTSSITATATEAEGQQKQINVHGDMTKTILVAEDNSTNQKVIQSMLSRLGYGVVIAENGLKALELAAESAPDLVLSDLHMPVMDGYGLVKSWRNKVLNGELPDINIIALTANVAEGEKQRCLDAGFNDYLVKPLPMQQLKQVLEQVFQRLTAESASGVTTESNNDTEWIDVNYLIQQVGETDVKEVLADYAQCLSVDSDVLQLALQQNNTKQVVMLAHKLKSSSRYVGAKVLADALAEIEALAKMPQAELQPLADKVNFCIQRTLNDLRMH